MRAELNQLADKNLIFCKPLLKAVKTGFNGRFKDLMDINCCASVPLYLAMMSHPFFKINFIPELRNNSSALEYVAKCKGMLLKAIEIIDLEEQQKESFISDPEPNANSQHNSA